MLALVLLAGCGGEPAASVETVVPGGPELPGPGSEIGAGFTVPEGAVLLGTTFPDLAALQADLAPEEIWDADLLITGNATEVLDELTEQTRDAGRTVAATCGVEAGFASCSLGSRRVVDGFEVEVVRGEAFVSTADQRGWASHLQLRYVRWPEGQVPDEGPLSTAGVALGEMPEHLPPPPPPGIGQPVVHRRHQAASGPLLTVAEGSAIVAPVNTGDNCTGGFLAHLLITGGIEDVVDEYRRQFEDFFASAEPVEVDEAVVDGRRIIAVSADISGGGSLDLHLVIGDDAPTWARIHRCGD